MSESEGNSQGPELDPLDSLEAAVQRALRQLDVWRERALASESERRRLEEKLAELAGPLDDGDPSDLRAEVERLQEKNEELRDRLAEGRRQAEEIARQVEFLEDTR